MVFRPWMYLILSILFLVLMSMSYNDREWFPMIVGALGTVMMILLAYASHKHYHGDY